MTDELTQQNRFFGISMETMELEKKLSLFRIMFPFVSTKEALKEKYFAKGYAYSCLVFGMENREAQLSMNRYLEQALEEYQKSYEEAGSPEAIANLLWVMCVSYACAAEGETAMIDTEHTESCYETGMLLIGILREAEEYRALAEYYLALLYVIGMGSNGAGVDFNKAVGVEMMKALVHLGNAYAVELAKECEWVA